MARATSDREFRNLKINDHTEVIFELKEIYDENNSFNTDDVTSALQSGNPQGALDNALEQILTNNFPLEEDARDAAVIAILNSMLSFKNAEISQYVQGKGGNIKEIDILMLLTYAGMKRHNGLAQTRLLFTWHDNLSKYGGHGSILRVLNDKRDL